MIIRIRKTADKPHGSMQFFFFSLNLETKQTYKTYIFRVRFLVSKESIYYKIFSVLNNMFSSVAQLHPTLCDPVDCSTPDFPVHHQLSELTQTHVHRVGDVIQPSHPLLSPSPPAFNLSQNQGLFK